MSTHNQEAPENLEKAKTPEVTKVGKDHVISTDAANRTAVQQTNEVAQRAPRFTTENGVPFQIDMGNGQVVEDNRPKAKGVADAASPEARHGIGGVIADVSNVVSENITPAIGTALDNTAGLTDQMNQVLQNADRNAAATDITNSAGDSGHHHGGFLGGVTDVVQQSVSGMLKDLNLPGGDLVNQMESMNSQIGQVDPKLLE